VGGFFEVIDARWVSMFAGQELQMLVSGVESDAGWDVDDLREHCQYAGGYHEGHPTVEAFWEVLRSFSPADKAALLKFVTSCSRPPLLGFRYLEPQMGVQMSGHVGDAEASRLPSAATCMNLLKLPPYKSPRVLREKLLTAIHSGAGFDLS